MRLSDLAEYFVLRRHLVRPWRFLRTRKRPPAGEGEDIAFRGGFAVRVRNVPMDRHILHRIFARDEYRLGGVAAGSWDTVVDVGAHIGLFAVRAAPLARRVVCFEPSPENRAVLERNLSDPRFSHVTVDPRAVAGTPGRVTLHLSSNPSAHSLVGAQSGEPAGTTEVEATTLVDAFREHGVERCDLLKLDCEGAEYAILEAAEDALWPRIERMAMECHPAPGWDAGRLAALLEGKGYRCEVAASKRRGDKAHLFARRGPG